MKSIVILVVLFAGAVWAADEVADRASIENTIQVFNAAPSRGGLFTSDFDDAELVRYGKSTVPGSGAIPVKIEGVPGEVVISKEPMGEAIWLPEGKHAPMAVKKIRFLTAEVAMVDAAGRRPVLIVLKKVGTDWKIASLRVLPEN
jgi:hypothetical protein